MAQKSSEQKLMYKLNRQNRLEEQQAKIATQIEKLQKTIVEEREKNYKEAKALFSKVIQTCIEKDIDAAILKEKLLELQTFIDSLQNEKKEIRQHLNQETSTNQTNLKSELTGIKSVPSNGANTDEGVPAKSDNIEKNPYHLDIISE
ncbi:MAG: hypothetical protein IJ873_08945 [Lachnospiraceae bacterium]|nr:hypothetical protein [Lachnospiraceae bacterium]